MILSIVTGTYNRLSYLQDFMESCRKQIPPGISYEFCIADGGSTDGTIEWLEGNTDVKLLKQGELTGAIKAFNAAASMASGDYLFVANDDIVVREGSIMRALSYMLQHPACGAGCFLQDRAGKEAHVEMMPTVFNGKSRQSPYIQVGLIPRWLWEYCGGWGDWGGRTYGGDNYVSAKIYEAGYDIVAIPGTFIHDRTPDDELRKVNNTRNLDGEKLYEAFPNGFKINSQPQVKNPLKPRKRCVYAPLFEPGYERVQKVQKRGLRDALSKRYLVWEVDYNASKEDVAEACEVWEPDLCLTQFHNADHGQDVRKMREHSKVMVNWNGDTWTDQQTEEKSIRMLSYFDLQTGVNNSLSRFFKSNGIEYRFWPVSFENNITK